MTFTPSCNACSDAVGSVASKIPEFAPNSLVSMSSPKEMLSDKLIKTNNSELNKMSIKERMQNKDPATGLARMAQSKEHSDFSKSDTELHNKVIMSGPHSTMSMSSLCGTGAKVTVNASPLLKGSLLSSSRMMTSRPSSSSLKKPMKFVPSVRKKTAFSSVTQTRTWHRTGTPSSLRVETKVQGNNVAPLAILPKDPGKLQNSYIRRGNSLVRKSSPVDSVPRGLHASGSSLCHSYASIDNSKDSESKDRSDILSSRIPAGGSCAEYEMLNMLSFTGSKNLNVSAYPNPVDSTCALLTEQTKRTGSAAALDPSLDGLKSSGVIVSKTNINTGQSRLDKRNTGKKVTYVKRKLNQLVAASISGEPRVQRIENSHGTSDGYYKSRRNQLIRTASEDDLKQKVVPSAECFNSDREGAQKNAQGRRFSKKLPGSSLKRSLVWTLYGSFPSRKQRYSGYICRVLPYLVPKKRSFYRPHFKSRWGSMPNESSACPIGRKLLLSKKRDIVYKRSITGFSLKLSKVFSAGSRSLKWSKSIGRISKSAEEDAKRAVVAAQKREKEQSGGAFSLPTSKNHVSRERIFRIGPERYKMDPAGRILQRISDDEAPYTDAQAEKNLNKYCVPRRLLIGNNEYVRIGNGNQLIRNPKQRTRALATERVRWSLHTARLRLARKKNYCQFFTRFGKCNKDDNKCPYIHDPSKVVVCTKFLNASCFNPDCKLTHEIIPERMQDCSYFMQGCCSNESCPYRHVNVNSKSPVCEEFLRGYCADGNECRKKHTYVCPAFEATGSCDQGSNCKLHHPINRKKVKKRKVPNVLKNARGRYFGAGPFHDAPTIVPEIVLKKSDDIQDGELGDYISLDIDNETIDQVVEYRADPAGNTGSQASSEITVGDLDEFIKPIRILKRTKTSA